MLSFIFSMLSFIVPLTVAVILIGGIWIYGIYFARKMNKYNKSSAVHPSIETRTKLTNFLPTTQKEPIAFHREKHQL
jgi:hypothetical protein